MPNSNGRSDDETGNLELKINHVEIGNKSCTIHSVLLHQNQPGFENRNENKLNVFNWFWKKIFLSTHTLDEQHKGW